MRTWIKIVAWCNIVLSGVSILTMPFLTEDNPGYTIFDWVWWYMVCIFAVALGILALVFSRRWR